MPDPITSAELETYQSTIMQIVLMARILKDIDLPKLIETIDHANAIGPFVDPTLWMQKVDAMSQDKKLLEAALPLRELGIELAAHFAAKDAT